MARARCVKKDAYAPGSFGSVKSSTVQYSTVQFSGGGGNKYMFLEREGPPPSGR